MIGTENLTVAELLLYSTVRVVATSDAGEINGTGFFYSFREGDKSAITLVTNRHVIDGAGKIVILLHRNGGESRPHTDFTELHVELSGQCILNHTLDLCAIDVSRTLEVMRQRGNEVFLTAIEEGLIPSAEDWSSFDALESVLMIGCPNGLFDQHNNLPIIRTGSTATSLTRHYEGKPEFLVDMACFPGSSGSPVFLYDRGPRLDRKSGMMVMGASGRLFLLGILYAGPTFTHEGVVLGRPRTTSIDTMMHLGCVLRSTALIDLRRSIIWS